MARTQVGLRSTALVAAAGNSTLPAIFGGLNKFLSHCAGLTVRCLPAVQQVAFSQYQFFDPFGGFCLFHFREFNLNQDSGTVPVDRVQTTTLRHTTDDLTLSKGAAAYKAF
jgi:hypothetical protein